MQKDFFNLSNIFDLPCAIKSAHYAYLESIIQQPLENRCKNEIKRVAINVHVTTSEKNGSKPKKLDSGEVLNYHKSSKAGHKCAQLKLYVDNEEFEKQKLEHEA